MPNHLTHHHLTRYLERDLDATESRAVWEHLRQCDQCSGRLAQEETLRRHLQQGFSRLRFATPDLHTQLSQVLLRTERPLGYTLNLTTFLMGISLTFLALIPMMSQLYFHAVNTAPVLINIPLATEVEAEQSESTETSQPQTVGKVSHSHHSTPVALNYNYASPAPPPHATAFMNYETPLAHPNEK